MNDLSTLLQSTNAWLFIPSAILLGALHGLEPGHSKTMMAAFIIAIRGTVMQAVLLGLAATLSHTAVVWAIAMAGLHFGGQWTTEATEPYLQLISAAVIIGVALWMIWRTWMDQQPHGDHSQGEQIKTIDTGHGVVTIEILEDGGPPRWRVGFPNGKPWSASDVSVETIRPDGVRQAYAFAQVADGLNSTSDIPEPHDFKARLSLSHGNHAHSYDVEFHEHDHGHDHSEATALPHAGSLDATDAHARAHADDIARRFSSGQATTVQILMFGLTGGLIPCPASITVLLLCLQLKKVALGAALVLCFSLGLALTMVTVGVVAALSVQHVSRRWKGFSAWAQRAPYISSILIMAVGMYSAYLGWSGLSHPA